MNTDNESFEEELQSATAQQANHEMQAEHTTTALSDIEMQTIPEDTEMQEQDRGRPTDRLPRTGGEQPLDTTKDRLDAAQDSAMAESSPPLDRPRPGEKKVEMQERSGGPGLLASASAAASARNRTSAIPTSSTEMNLTEDSDAEPPDTGFR